jgi:hypothetical protein
VALLWPAFANGYPLVFPDSASYIDNAYTLRFFPARSVGYALFLRYTLVADSLWAPVAIQALVTAYLVVRTAFVAANPRRPHLVAASALLAVVLLTGAGKYVSWIMPDVFAGWLLLGGALFVLSGRLFDRVPAAIVVMCAAVVHASNFPLAVATCLVVLLAAAIGARRYAIRALALLGIVLATVPLMLLVHRAYGHDQSPIGGHPAFLVNRLHGAGILVPTLDRYCGEKKWALCRYRDILAANAREGSDWFLWSRASPRRTLGGWNSESREEYAEIARYAIRSHFPEFVRGSLGEAWRQFWLVRSDQGIGRVQTRYLTGLIARRLPGESAAFRSSKQASGREPRGSLLPRGAEQGIHVGLFALGVGLAVVCWFRGGRRFAALEAAIVVLLGANALLVGFVSTPSDRLQGRIAWLVVWSLVLSASFLVQRDDA